MASTPNLCTKQRHFNSKPLLSLHGIRSRVSALGLVIYEASQGMPIGRRCLVRFNIHEVLIQATDSERHMAMVSWTFYGLIMPVHCFQAPPCDMPLRYASSKSSARKKARVKQSEEDKKLEAARELTIAQYSKIRYKLPAEALAAVTNNSNAQTGTQEQEECVLLRLNTDALEVNFRHEGIVDFLTASNGLQMAQVRSVALA